MAAVVIFVVDRLWKTEEKEIFVYFAAAFLAGSLILFWRMWLCPGEILFFGLLFTKFSLLLLIIFSFFAVLFVLLAYGYFQIRGVKAVPYLVFLLITAFGMMMALATSNLVVIFWGMIISSAAARILISAYVENSLFRILKKFLIYQLSSEILFFAGTVFYFISLKSFDLLGSNEIVNIVNAALTGRYFKLSMALFALSFVVKLGLFPFHWFYLELRRVGFVPVAGFAVILTRTFALMTMLKVFVPSATIWGGFLDIPFTVLGFVTVFWGALRALREKDILNIFFYSSMVWVGLIVVLFPYLVVGFDSSLVLLLFLIFTFVLLHLGIFAILQMLSYRKEIFISSLDNIFRPHPWIAGLITIIIFSLMGFPPFAGFMAKFLMVSKVASAGSYLVLTLILVSFLMIIFFLGRVLAHIYLSKAGEAGVEFEEFEYPVAVVIVLVVLLSLYLGIAPTSFVNLLLASIP